MLASPDSTESLRVGFADVPISAASPGLRMFIDHSQCCNRSAPDLGCDLTQNAPLPALPGETNVSMRIFVDGGLVEVYAMDMVALTAVVAPLPNVATPEQRLVRALAEGTAGSPCEVHEWRLSL